MKKKVIITLSVIGALIGGMFLIIYKAISDYDEYGIY